MPAPIRGGSSERAESRIAEGWSDSPPLTRAGDCRTMPKARRSEPKGSEREKIGEYAAAARCCGDSRKNFERRQRRD
jgi:hypothetical protein